MKSSHTFVDEARITVTAGDGGDGMVGYRREKYVPNGGPNGGDGGRGGDVVLVADEGINTLLDFHHGQHLVAEHGRNGGPQGRTGASGSTLEIRLPVGTVVFDVANEPPGAGEDDFDDSEFEPLVDLSTPGQRFLVARGGNGGFGNQRFKKATRQTPDFALPGRPGESRELRLSLKLLADVGLIGFPNAGKSTLLRRISAARPKVASYPFTTLTPSLGVVELDDRRFVVADIPGLIEGASDGAGLGHRFLRHIERTRVLVHLLDVAAMLSEGRDLIHDYEAIRTELERYRPELARRREIVVLNKLDVVHDPEELAPLREALARRHIEALDLSSATGEGIPRLVRCMLDAVDAARAEEAAQATTEPDAQPGDRAQ